MRSQDRRLSCLERASARRQALLDDLSDAELERLCNLLTPLSQPPTQEQLDALSPDDRAFLLAMEDRFSEAIE